MRHVQVDDLAFRNARRRRFYEEGEDVVEHRRERARAHQSVVAVVRPLVVVHAEVEAAHPHAELRRDVLLLRRR